MLGLVWPFLVYWVLLFVAFYVIVEYGQTYFYDEPTPATGLKVLGGSLALAVLLTWARTSYDTMLTSELPRTVLQAIVWFVVFLFVFRFHPWHALGLSVAALLLVPGLATMTVNSMTGAGGTPPPIREPSKPLRRPASVPLPPPADTKGAPAPAEPAKAAAPAAK